MGYREAMTLAIQPESMVIVGSGAIGVEFAYVYNALGTKVTIMFNAALAMFVCGCRGVL